MCTAPGGWLILSRLFFFILLILFTLAESLNYYTKVMVGMQAGSRGLTINAGVVWLFLRTKIVYLYQVYRQTYSCFVVYKDYSYRYKCIINFLKCVCVVIFYFLHYCGNLTRWLVFWVVSFAFRMTRGWAILIVFDCVIAL